MSAQELEPEQSPPETRGAAAAYVEAGTQGETIMWHLLAAAISIAATAFGYVTARTFVREKLRYVDAAQKRRAPLIAGLVAWAIAMPLVWILPLVGPATALLFGAAVAFGVRSGARDIREGHRISSGTL